MTGETTNVIEDSICINKGRPVYFSYARNSNKNPEWNHISDCVEKLLEIFDKENIEYRVDKRDIGAGDKISDFEREIGWKSEVVVIVFSDKYFRSLHCMYEFVQIKNALKSNPNKRLLCIKSGDFNLADIKYILELEHFWGDQRQEYEEIDYHRLRDHSGTEKAACENGFYLNDIRNLYSFFSAINYSNSKNEDWSNFVNDIVRYYTPKPAPSEEIKSILTPPPLVTPKAASKPPTLPKSNVVSQPQPAKQVEAPVQVLHVHSGGVSKTMIAIMIAMVLICFFFSTCLFILNKSESSTPPPAVAAVDKSSSSGAITRGKNVNTQSHNQEDDYDDEEEIIIQEPKQDDGNGWLHISKIGLYDNSTAVMCLISNPFNDYMSLSLSGAIKIFANGYSYNLTNGDDVIKVYPEKTRLQPGDRCVCILEFPPIPKSVYEFDLIWLIDNYNYEDGEDDGVYGVKLR